MPFNVLESIDAKERLTFSQNFDVARPTVLDRLFPDVKTEFIEAEYLRLMQGQNLPTAAFVHALDTEAVIGQRPSFEKVLQEKLFYFFKNIDFKPFIAILENYIKEFTLILH